MKIFQEKQVWFVTGSQHLYGPKVLETVAKDTQEIINEFNTTDAISVPVVNAGTVTTPDEILAVCQKANNDPNCIGLMLWMHTFSPAKMWIAGLSQLNKPFLHLHTQFRSEIPWNDIDMDYMNTHQSAHGCREFGFIGTRLGIDRKVIAGHWKESSVHSQIDDWCRAAIGIQEGQQLKVARFGDNMRQVAVTEGNKVSAQIQFGFEVNAYGLGELSDAINSVADGDVTALIEEYIASYEIESSLYKNEDSLQIIKNDAKIELGMEHFLKSVGAHAFTNTFENLTGMTNLPGLATQRLMAKGYGYGGEGDWKTAAMTRIMKVMAKGKPQGTSFMEDYTYNFGGNGQVLGAHMLEVCPSIADAKPKLEIHRHTIGCSCDVARLVFTGAAGPAINVSVIDLGSRYRMLANVVDTVTPTHDLPKLPVACTLWEPQPSLQEAAAAWIYGGGAHHTVHTQALSLDTLASYADMTGIELAVIDNKTDLRQFKTDLKLNDLLYRLMAK